MPQLQNALIFIKSFAFLYDFSKDGGSVGILNSQIIVPDDSLIIISYGLEIIPCAGGNVSIGYTGTPNALFGPALPGGPLFIGNMDVTNQNKKVIMTIAGAPLTAGKFTFNILCFQSNF